MSNEFGPEDARPGDPDHGDQSNFSPEPTIGDVIAARFSRRPPSV